MASRRVWWWLVSGVVCLSAVGARQAWERIEEFPDAVNCDFGPKFGLCAWRPSNVDSADVWRTGNAVVVDSVNSITKAADGDDFFAYAQGEYGAPSSASIESPEIAPAIRPKDLKFSYWKVATTPILDICTKDPATQRLDCLDSVSGPGQQQWVRRSVRVPAMSAPFRLVFRVRNLHSAEDLVGLDDVQWLNAMSASSESAPSKTAVMNRPKLYPGSAKKQSSNSFGVDFPHQVARDTGARGKTFEAPVRPVERGRAPVETDKDSVRDEDDFRDLPAGDRDGFVVPLKMNKLSMSPAAEAIVPVKPNGGTVSLTGMQTNPLNLSLPTFPSFPSLPQGMTLSEPRPARAQTMEPLEVCKAVKCSFLENACLWQLGSSWKRADGNIAMELAGEDAVVSAHFKAPLASYLEFDLWMSDDSFLSVLELMDGLEVPLFSRQGMSNNGWHRFRIPLRPSFNPVRVKVRNTLPPEGFITLSNTRLVNGNGDEVPCETVPDAVAVTAIPNLLAPVLMPPTPVPPMLKARDPERVGVSYGGSIFDGLKPIEPRKEDQTRLTAFQGYNPKMLVPTTREPFVLPKSPSALEPPPFPALNPSFPGLPQSLMPNMQPLAPPQDLLARLGADPVMEQRLRQLAAKFGFDTNKVPDPGTLDLLKRFVGPQLAERLGTVSRGVKTVAGGGNVDDDAPKQVMDEMKPIKPVNVDSEEFDRVYKEEEERKRMWPALTASQTLNADILKQFPEPSADKHEANLSFVTEDAGMAYGNALSG